LAETAVQDFPLNFENQSSGFLKFKVLELPYQSLADPCQIKYNGIK